MMLDAAQMLACVGALMLLVSGAFWIKVGDRDEMHGDGLVVARQVDRASKLLAISVAFSAVAAVLAIVPWITG